MAVPYTDFLNATGMNFAVLKDGEAEEQRLCPGLQEYNRGSTTFGNMTSQN